MTENRPLVVIFGAGMTGRGHIAQLAFEGGWDIVFVDTNEELIKTLVKAEKYTVHLVSEYPREVVITGYRAIHAQNVGAISSAIDRADMVITSVLPNNLGGVAVILVQGLKLRLKNKRKPLNIISAENMDRGSSKLWELTAQYLTEEEQGEYGKSFGFPDSMIARVVPRSLTQLYLIAEDYNEWTADALNRVGELPTLKGLEWVENQEARLKRKLYIHNTGHAVCAYLGFMKGYDFIHESARDKWIMRWVRRAMLESGQAVCKEFGFDGVLINDYAQSLIKRLPMDVLPDGIDRVVREPIRKLGLDDRFVGPLILCEKYDLPKNGLCLGIASVLASGIKDEQGLYLASLIKENGVIGALSQVSNYTPNLDSSRRIVMYYDALRSLTFSSIGADHARESKPEVLPELPPAERKYDLLGLGIVAVDDLFMVENYPDADSKTRATGVIRQGGGLTGTALVAASRLGAKCAYGGVLGQDELSNWTLEELEKEGIDCSLAIRSADVKPYHAIIIVDTTHHSRAIIFSDEGVQSRPVDTVDEDFVSGARVVLLDQLGIDVMLKTALIAKKLGILTVADIEREDHPKTRELLSQIDHLILSTSFCGKLTGKDDPIDQVRALHAGSDRACSAVTVGVRGCWYITNDNPDTVQHQPAYKVQVVDTTGCGDVFHGAYGAGLAWDWPVAACMRFASATAALKATKPGGRSGIPDKATVELFLSGNPETYS